MYCCCPFPLPTIIVEASSILGWQDPAAVAVAGHIKRPAIAYSFNFNKHSLILTLAQHFYSRTRFMLRVTHKPNTGLESWHRELSPGMRFDLWA